MDLMSLVNKLPDEKELAAQPRPFYNHSIGFKSVFTPAERARTLEQVGLNVFFFPSEMITGCDLLSDSGTSTMTNEQWAVLHLGDESYASNKGYFLLMERIRDIFGDEFFNDPSAKIPNAFIFHQGRPGEDALFTQVGKLGTGMTIPNNGTFDTTQANIEANNMKAVNLFSSEMKDQDSKSHFKGNMNVDRLRQLLEKNHSKVPLMYLTITNNSAGGQPVSMENIKDVSQLSQNFGVPLFFDACRFAENAWFIKKFEKGYSETSIQEIVKEMFSYVDGFTISFKKDGLVNMGGGLFLRDNGMFIKKYPHIPDALLNYQIMKEGHPTYGGLSGREIVALETGLKTIIKENYLTHRICQVQEFGYDMHAQGIPVVTPVSGHAVYIDMEQFFAGTQIKPENYGGISFSAVLLACYGHRVSELGNFAFGSYDKKNDKETFPEFDFVRIAVPRLRYDRQDLASVAESVKVLYDNRNKIPPVRVTYGRDLSLRHFKARFEFVH